MGRLCRWRTVLIAIVIAGPMLMGQIGGLGQAQSGGLVSGALGLTRPEIEAKWGQGVGPFAGPGSYFNIYEMYTYYSQRGTYHVAYQDTTDLEIVIYLENNLPGGMSEREAQAMTVGYLPDDARRTEVFTAPPTPDGGTALRTYRYVSPSLATAYDGLLAEEVLVTFYERWDDPELEFDTRVTAVSMMVRTITQ